jgi:hypothetical protein
VLHPAFATWQGFRDGQAALKTLNNYEKEMIMTKDLSFNDLRHTAERLGQLIDAIQTGVGYQHKLSGKGKNLKAIAVALDLIGNTPNATINSRALDAWREEVDTARKAIKVVTKEILSRHREEDDDNLRDIPY